MTIGGSVLILIGMLTLTLPDGPLTVFGFGGGRTLPFIIGAFMVVLSLSGRFSPSPVLRWLLVVGSMVAATLALVDTDRLAGAPRGAGMGVTLAGALVVVGGTFLRAER